jgi:hypothetical protein
MTFLCQGEKVPLGGRSNIFIPSLIKWCLDKGLDEPAQLNLQPEKIRIGRKTTSLQKDFFYRLVRPKDRTHNEKNRQI